MTSERCVGSSSFSVNVQRGSCPRPETLRLSRQIPTTFEAKNQLLEELIAYLRACGIENEVELFRARLCIDEGLQNAFSHGNSGDPSKRIHVWLFEDAEGWGIDISDEGQGFAPSDLPDPTTTSGLWMEHGRGLMIMCHYMDEVSYFDGGRTLRLYKRKPLRRLTSAHTDSEGAALPKDMPGADEKKGENCL